MSQALRRVDVTRASAAHSTAAPAARQRSIALMCLMGTTLLWGSGLVFTWTALQELRPFPLVVARFVVAALGLLPFALRELRAAPAWLTFPWRRVVVMGVLGVGIYYSAYT